MNVNKNCDYSLGRLIRHLANLWCFVGILVSSIVRDTDRKGCFQCQVGSKATGEWRDLFLCRYNINEPSIQH